MSKIGDSARHGFLTNDFAYLFVCVFVIMCGYVCEVRVFGEGVRVYYFVEKQFMTIKIIMFIF